MSRRALFARRIVAVVTMCIAVMTGLVPSVASAHAILVYSTPAPSSVLPKSPDQIELGFSEEVEANLSGIRLFDNEQKEIRIGKTRSGTGKSVVVAEIPSLANGTYVVVWRVTSSDGHPVNGAFPFEIGTVSTGKGNELVDRVQAAVERTSPLGGALSVAKFLTFLGFVVLVGTMVFTWGTQFLGSARALSAALSGLLILLLGTLSVLLLQGAYVTGGGWSDIGTMSLVGDVLTTRIGIAMVARIFLAVMWVLLLQLLRRQPWNSVTGTLVVLLSVLMAVTFSVAGHPAAATLTGIFVPVDVVHLVSVAAWIGGVVVMFLLRHELASDPDVVATVSRFSRVATWVMPVAIATGLAQGVHLIGGLSAMGDSDYSWMLVGKAGLVVVVVLLGTRARRTLLVDESVSNRFTKVVRLEAIVAVIVLALTAGLVNTSPVASVPPVESFSARLVQRNVIAELTVTPPKVGTAEIHALFTPPGGSITPVKNVRVRMTLQARDIPAIPVEMIQIGANHWSGVVQLPYAGDWAIEVLVSPQENTELRYSTTVPVKD